MVRSSGILLAAMVAGCDRSSLPVSHWELDGQPIRLPAHLPLQPVPQRVRLTARVELPREFQSGAILEIPVVHSLPTLVADGVPAVVTDAFWTDQWRATGGRRFIVPQSSLADGVVQLELSFDHRWVMSAWWDVTPRLVPLDSGPGLGAFVRGAGAFAFFTLLLLVFHVLNLIRFRYSESAAWFMLEAAAGIPYPALTLGLLQSAEVYEPAFMGFSLCVSAFASLHFVRAQLSLPAPHRGWRYALVFAAAVYGSVAVFAPFRLVQLGAPITVSLMLATSVDQLLTFATEKKAPLRAVALIWPVTNFLALPDMFMWLGWGEVLGGLHPGVIGVGFLVLAQSLVLSREHAASQVMTDRLNQALAARIRELEVRQREVQRLNDELRHQLAERSKELERLAPAVATGEERMLESGELIAERYRVVKRIALGATGEVLEVLRESDGVRLAMKVLQRNEPSDTARLAREARLIATLQHENLVSIVDVGMSGDSLFLVMPLAIASVRDERPRYGDRAWATTMLLQVAGGLEALHAAGVVHRDVKPGNVLLMSPGRYQLADLGAATPQYPLEDEHQTTSLRVLGTPIYMAPELYDGRPVTVKVDVFSFAVMALEVLTGHVPRLNGQPMGKALMQHAEPSLPALDVFDASTGPWFRRALAVDASVRPTITELKAALLRWATTTV